LIEALKSNDTAEVSKAISAIESAVETDIDSGRRSSLLVALVQAYQGSGEHESALKAIERIPDGDYKLDLVKLHFAGRSYSSLGAFEHAADLYQSVIESSAFSTFDPVFRIGVFMEAGKANSFAKNDSRARSLWRNAERLAKRVGEDLDALRAASNISMIDLHSQDPEVRASAANNLEHALRAKAELNDAEGVANNACTLAFHYWREKRYGRATSYLRLDLRITREGGDRCSLCVSLCNLAGLYIEMKQFKTARPLLIEAIDIAKSLNDVRADAIARANLERLEEAARTLGMAGEAIGPKALCACGSSLEYQDCCGRADFDPPEGPFTNAEIADEALKVIAEFKERRVEPTALDYILRPGDQASERRSWTRVHMLDGWAETFELPDMSNNYLLAASELYKQAESEPDAITAPLSIAILSVCSIEAFINQVAFQLTDLAEADRLFLPSLPVELEVGALEFQRRTDLVTKWECIGRVLCGPYWPLECWLDTKTLISIRNELVHFKSAEYEQVIPRPRIDVALMRALPKAIQTRQVDRAWPYRLLTPSLAAWALQTARNTIEQFKLNYRRFRMSGGVTAELSQAKHDGVLIEYRPLIAREATYL
jgi:tetratricopeptide (TPR) repeat protein